MAKLLNTLTLVKPQLNSKLFDLTLRTFSNSKVLVSKQPALPDYNTSVNIHEHKLKRPDKPPPKWTGLKGLEKRAKGSLIPDTLKEMEESEEFKLTAARLKELGQKKLTREERKQRQRALDNLGIPSFVEFWQKAKLEFGIDDPATEIRKQPINIFQINVGLYCNQACNHCHVESSPKRKEMMDRKTADKCLEVLANSPSVHTLDLTGGAPELCDQFRHLAKGARELGKTVIDRCNLTVLEEPGQEDLGEFLAENKIQVIASLPCYTAKNVNTQRGSGVFDKSISALRKLNSLGFGVEGSDLHLDLVYNPLGNYLPPPQEELAHQYKTEMMENFGVEFNMLFTMTNMPIKRFADFLYRRNELQEYLELLVRNYNIATIDNLMCRNHLNVSWTGELFDCDFNQQMSLGIHKENDKKGLSVFDITSTKDLEGLVANNDNHCFGCSAGMGSS
ncbi:unnamed protein product [Owenia fusiformis]|uniref:Uncharacterized protein n=1 Tax=Owenia fusiformis TaxID=6347 RepID=A0A8J1YD72_OWEFU|nr:unnamed protein product [Owenia fusiformis]